MSLSVNHQPPLLRGALNFRDIGGLTTLNGDQTARGAVYRSDALDDVTPEDVGLLSSGLGVGLVIDLRSQVEDAGTRPAWAGGTGISFASLPLVEDWETYDVSGEEARRTLMARKYLGFLEGGGRSVVAGLRLLADLPPGQAAVVHCAVGKDRTGVLIAILLSVLSVRREAIVADYVATAPNLPALLARMNRKELYRRRMLTNPPEVYRADAHTMEIFLSALDERAGGPVEWARSNGLDAAAIDRLRARLVVPAGAEMEV